MPQDEAAPGALNGSAGAQDHAAAYANSQHADGADAHHANGHTSQETGSQTSNSQSNGSPDEGDDAIEQSNTGTFETVSVYHGSADHSAVSADSAALSPSEADGGRHAQDRVVRVNDMQSHIIPFRSSTSSFHEDFEMAGPANELQTLEEARAAVRDVFSSLNDAARPVNGSPYVEPVLTPSGDVAADRSRFSVFSSEPTHYQSDPSETEQTNLYQNSTSEEETASEAGENLGFDNGDGEENVGDESASNASSEEEDVYSESEPLTDNTDNTDNEEVSHSGGADNTSEAAVLRQMGTKSLSGEDADAAIRAALTRHYARDNLEPVQNQDFDLARQLEAQLKSQPMQREQGDNRLTELQNRPALPLESLAFTEFNREEAPEADGENRVDEELLQQLEKTKPQTAGHRRSGGLLLAAAWGLFLSIAAGLIGGGLAFRDIAAEALPGLAPVYRYLGMPVTVQPLSFDNVRYEWSTTDSRPTLVISGAVVNKAHRKVKTPDFYLTVKDQDPQLDREYSIALPVDGAKIRAKQQADFRIELVAPNPSITAVELELRNVE